MSESLLLVSRHLQCHSYGCFSLLPGSEDLAIAYRNAAGDGVELFPKSTFR
jgi:hypothetical protein